MRLKKEIDNISSFKNNAAPTLEINGLSLDFMVAGHTIEAVADLHLIARSGRITALVGESGSGKSATSLAVMGIEAKNARIKGGSIFLSGVDTLKLSQKERRRYVSSRAGIIFQDPMESIDPLFTVGYQLIEAARVHEKLTYQQAYTLAVEQLKAVSLPEPEILMKKYPFMLSGGMCQRVMIAIATIARPPLLIADEPTTALDVTVQSQILKQLDHLRRQENIAVLLITHDLGVVAELADDVYIMRRGRIVESGNVFEIFDQPHHEYTRLLMESSINNATV